MKEYNDEQNYYYADLLRENRHRVRELWSQCKTLENKAILLKEYKRECNKLIRDIAKKLGKSLGKGQISDFNISVFLRYIDDSVKELEKQNNISCACFLEEYAYTFS